MRICFNTLATSFIPTLQAIVHPLYRLYKTLHFQPRKKNMKIPEKKKYRKNPSIRKRNFEKKKIQIITP